MTQLDELEKLHDLKEKGILSETEFEMQKKALLKQNVNTAPTEMVSMKEAYTSYWKKSFVWSGRSTRAEYWWPYLVNFLINVVIATVTALMPLFSLMTVIFGIANIFPGLAVYVRRMHDVNKSAWFGFMPFLLGIGLAIIAIIGAVYDYIVDYSEGSDIFNSIRAIVYVVGGLAFVVMSIVLFVYTLLPGTKGKNRYGDPR